MTAPSTGPHQFAMPAWISTAPFEQLLNMTIHCAEDGKATLSMPFYQEYCNGAGLMHGGALVSLADTAVVMAIKSLVEPGSHFATIKMEVSFLHPVKKGVVTARAEVVSREERIIQGITTVYDDEERGVMEFRSTFKIARDVKVRGITFGD
ncbi:PaaI family thioesterase [Geomonas sp. Red32]|uniref:PaaI family thioesterase n=1 Tax=Geomonas sp. Red32 TaxID=2912856 RepID=UPI00202CF297|nr:PaaI family thioesterase [Geomonas sp. Red32]MCM0082739.1 PaaI family thioesterase [Geomonas sp. Red32]